MNGVKECQPLLTVIIPIWNEAATLPACVQSVVSVAVAKQVIIVDDGSTDGTSDLVASLVEVPGICAFRHQVNRGKGAAIRTALPHATGRFTIIQDGDLEYCPQDYDRLLAPLLGEEADVVYGSRYLGKGCRGTRRLAFDLGVKLLNGLVRWIYRVSLTDEATCYKVFPTSLLQAMDLQCDRFEFCPEVTAKSCRLGLRIVEVPIRYTPRTAMDGKKLRLRDGLAAVRTLWMFRKWNGCWRREARVG